MNHSPRFAASLKEHNLCGLFSENDDERWVYREECPELLFVRDKDGLVYVNLAYDAGKAKKRRCRVTRRDSEEE